MAKGSISFGECEHGGDLDMYVSALCKSGATILNSSVDEGEEEGYVTFEVEDGKVEEFKEAFKKTEEYSRFSYLGGNIHCWLCHSTFRAPIKESYSHC